MKFNFSAKTYLWLEFILIYLGFPLLIFWIAKYYKPSFLMPLLWVVALYCGRILVKEYNFTFKDFYSLPKRSDLANDRYYFIIARFVLTTVFLVALIIMLKSELLFFMPREQTKVWFQVILLYPILSVIPQGIILRAFFNTRYYSLFPHPKLRTYIGVICFSWAHILFQNPIAVGLTFMGGMFFFKSYVKTKSLMVSNIEHSLYGQMIYTIGLGYYLYHVNIGEF